MCPEFRKKIERIQDIQKMVTEALEGNKIHKISRLLEIILAGAIAIKASDIHIEPEKDRGRLRLRLDGVLQITNYFGLDEIIIGCERHSIQHWLDNYKEIGLKNKYTAEQIKKYGKFIKSCARDFKRSKK